MFFVNDFCLQSFTKNITLTFFIATILKHLWPDSNYETSSSNEIVCPFEAEWKFHKADLMHLKNYKTGIGRGTNFGKTLDFFDAKNKFFVNGKITIKVKGIFIAPRPLIPKISTPISFQWKIKESDLKEIINEESYKGRLSSKPMNAFHNTKYYLTINPSIIREGKNEAKTRLYLFVEMGDETRIEAGSQGLFTLFWCSTNDLFDPSKGFIDDGYLTINLNGIFMKQKKQFFTLNYKRSLAPISFNDDKDFLIVVDGKKVQVHKQLLINVSPVLAGMFQSGMKEAIEGKMVIADFPFKIVEAAIKLLYGDCGTWKFVLEDLLLLYKFSDKYRIQFIMDLVEYHLIKHISPTIVDQLTQFSSPDSFNIKKLHQSCIKFLIKCFEEKIPINASESLDKDLVFNIFTNGFRPTIINKL